MIYLSFTSPCNHSRSLSGFRTHHFFNGLAMAAARLVVISNPLLFLNRISQVRNLCCNNRVSLSVSKNLLIYNALHNLQLHVKEQRQPETLNYRVFFHDSSKKKGFPLAWSTTTLGWWCFQFYCGNTQRIKCKDGGCNWWAVHSNKAGYKKGKASILSVRFAVSLYIFAEFLFVHI